MSLIYHRKVGNIEWPQIFGFVLTWHIPDLIHTADEDIHQGYGIKQLQWLFF